jgi:predicted ArsR family transcriptional regulator
MARREAFRGTQGRILNLLRKSAQTANEIAAQLGLTHNAIRGHLATLQRDGMVREAGWQRGASRPAVIYEVVPEAEAGLSKAYIPFVAHLMRILQEELPQGELDQIMHLVGRSLASEWPRLRGKFPERVEAASALLDDLGALNHVEQRNGGYVIRGRNCLLAAAVHRRPEVCRAMQSLLAELLEAPVRECCERGERPRCCFEIEASPGVSPSSHEVQA